MTTADIQQAPPSAGGEELSIPKHRFDQVNEELRRVREEVAMKDRLYLQDRQQTMAQQQQRPQGPTLPTAEELGLDPATYQSTVKLAKIIASQEVGNVKGVVEQQIGFLADRTEKAQFLATRGADKASLIPEIQKKQQEHFQMTGGFLPTDMAYELIRAQQLEEKVKRLEAQVAGQAPAAGVQAAPNPAPGPTPQSSAPGAYGTRQMPASGGAGAPAAQPGSSVGKSFSELSVEEMEARLSQQFGQGAIL